MSAKMKPDWDEDLINCIVEVRNVGPDLTEETLQNFFEIERRSGGGDVKRVIILRSWGCAWIQFPSSEMAERVRRKEEFVLSEFKIKVLPVSVVAIQVDESDFERIQTCLISKLKIRLEDFTYEKKYSSFFIQCQDEAIKKLLLSEAIQKDLSFTCILPTQVNNSHSGTADSLSRLSMADEEAEEHNAEAWGVKENYSRSLSEPTSPEQNIHVHHSMKTQSLTPHQYSHYQHNHSSHTQSLQLHSSKHAQQNHSTQTQTPKTSFSTQTSISQKGTLENGPDDVDDGEEACHHGDMEGNHSVGDVFTGVTVRVKPEVLPNSTIELDELRKYLYKEFEVQLITNERAVHKLKGEWDSVRTVGRYLRKKAPSHFSSLQNHHHTMQNTTDDSPMSFTSLPVSIQNKYETLDVDPFVWKLFSKICHAEIDEVRNKYSVNITDKESGKPLITGEKAETAKKMLMRKYSTAVKDFCKKELKLDQERFNDARIMEEIHKTNKQVKGKICLIEYNSKDSKIMVAACDEKTVDESMSSLGDFLGLDDSATTDPGAGFLSATKDKQGAKVPPRHAAGAMVTVPSENEEEKAKNPKTKHRKLYQTQLSGRSVGVGTGGMFGRGIGRGILGIGPTRDGQVPGLSIEVCEGDLTTLQVDAVVNAANTRLAHGGGVAGAIKAAAGPDLQRESDEIVRLRGEVAVGHAVHTPAYRMPCKYIIHAVGPRMSDYKDPKQVMDLLIQAFLSSMEVAELLRVGTVAIPAISSGIFGVPKPMVAVAMYQATIKFNNERKSHNLHTITFITIDPEMNDLIERVFLTKGKVNIEKYLNPFSTKVMPGRIRMDEDEEKIPVVSARSTRNQGRNVALNNVPKNSQDDTRGYNEVAPVHHGRGRGRSEQPMDTDEVDGYPGRTTDVDTGTSPTTSLNSEDDKCPICMDKIRDKDILPKCHHAFCKECLKECFKHGGPKCPVCKEMYGVVKGDQPENGKMDVRTSYTRLPGYEYCGSIVIDYHFPGGFQSERHPNPGQHYRGTSRTAYLPDNSEGREVLKLLTIAFDNRQTFTIGRSNTTGQNNVVVWNDIHHKTSTHGGPQSYGYPDADYLKRVKEELAAKGIK